MAVRDDDTAVVIMTATEFKHPIMDWSVEDVHRQFTVFKTFVKRG